MAKQKSVQEIVQMALRYDAGYTKDDFPELKDVIFWMRAGLSILAAIIIGVVGLTGTSGFGGGLALILLPPLAYYTGYLQVDVDSFGGGQELLTEALMPSVALFVLTWTAVYNALHLTSEDILQPYPA
ncbi:Rab5if [Symbiodinium sp. KB8]|nr:Rab5if [Symbiodinium sp. KB8]